MYNISFSSTVVCLSIEHLHYFDAHMQKGLFSPSRTETALYCFMVKVYLCRLKVCLLLNPVKELLAGG